MNYILVDDEPLAIQELTYLIKSVDPQAKVESSHSINTALPKLLGQTFDVAFLDIQMQEESGIELAQMINKLDHPPYIVFATAFGQYAIDAFHQNAVDYLLKPFRQEEVQRIIAKIQGLATNHKNSVQTKTEEIATSTILTEPSSTLPIQIEDRIIMIDPQEIIYLLADAGQVEIHLAEKVYISKTTLKALREKLSGQRFIQVHRSYVINQTALKEIQPWFNQTFRLTMMNGDKVPVSRSYLNHFKTMLGID
ncbi:LytR/AlgR family response regulator transcription factor [Ignavigranum ruoffiae]|uniref:LytR/AlgR family response regulator transcription factor n=1 Tax=Ignavigranum ruoffiae TaxID=89093 RepID=UPI0024ADD6A1|nr:LytTR family transcriptional regulator DNA-binding domain-containing protein [Ignavigranum ruoffiae]